VSKATTGNADSGTVLNIGRQLGLWHSEAPTDSQPVKLIPPRLEGRTFGIAADGGCYGEIFSDAGRVRALLGREPDAQRTAPLRAP
jgi:hypothetical protein